MDVLMWLGESWPVVVIVVAAAVVDRYGRKKGK